MTSRCYYLQGTAEPQECHLSEGKAAMSLPSPLQAKEQQDLSGKLSLLKRVFLAASDTAP